MKQHIVSELRKNGRTTVEAEQMLSEVTTAILQVARTQERASIPQFGVFRVKMQAERQMRNIQTGEMMTVAACNKLTFKQSKSINP